MVKKPITMSRYLKENTILCGYAEELMKRIKKGSVALSIWSPPYNIGKEYEKGQTYTKWKEMVQSVIHNHKRILKNGGFMVININDILNYEDKSMPLYHHENPEHQSKEISRERILGLLEEHPDYSIRKIAETLGCSHQTIQRRLKGVNLKDKNQGRRTHVELIGGLIQEYARQSGLYLYDRRIWKKDPAWTSSRWTTSSYRAVSEFEYIYIFWKPANIIINKTRLTSQEWHEWGLRGIWEISSVRRNNIHPAMFPAELPRRLIKLFTDEGDLVIDPFLGSGTTALAAKELGRNYIGFDKEEKHVALAQKRLKELSSCLG